MEADTKNSSTEDGTAGNAMAPSSSKLMFSKSVLSLIVICALAFLLRYFYIISLDHLLCQFGDAYFFLAGASKLREFVCNVIQSGNLHLWDSLPMASPNSTVIVRSIAVCDRLMTDGPIFPGYLALVQWIVGLPPGSLLFDSKALQISMVQALLDCFTCLCIFAGTRIAFGRKAALIAAFLFAIYPPSIINTQSCYTEPFACFMLSLWTWLALAAFARRTSAKPHSPLLFIVLGLVTALVALTRPPFLFLPFGFALLLTLVRFVQDRSWRPGKNILSVTLSLALGAFLVLAPWLAFTHKATGQYMLFVNRLPAFNMYLGNQLERDGWRGYPFQGEIPSTVGATSTQILKQAAAQPLNFLSLQLRKIPRLWAGIWNEFQYPLFGVAVSVQEMFHQTLLMLAILGFVFLVSKGTNWRDKDATICLLATIVVVHTLYLAFEPISRYAMTAAPLIVMLSAFMISALWSRPRSLAAFIFTVFVIVAASHASHLVVAYCACFAGGQAAQIAAGLFYVFLLALALFVLIRLLTKASFSSKPLTCGFAAIYLFGALLAFVSITGDPEMAEWRAKLTNPEQAAKQEFDLPVSENDAGSVRDYVLIDLQSGQSPVNLSVAVNGSKFMAMAQPWWQIQPNAGFLDVLALQEKAMATTLYKYRQWWVVSVPHGLVKYGAKNNISISCADTPVTIFGDFGDNKSKRWRLPALQLASWTKAFCTVDHHDARIYQTIDTAVARSSFCNGKIWAGEDLSAEPGKQCGLYRIRLVRLPAGANTKVVSATSEAAKVVPVSVPVPFISLPGQQLIAGDNPLVMHLADAAVNYSTLPGTQPLDTPATHAFALSCQICSANKSSGTAFIGLEFQGLNANGKATKWTSPWQPAAIQTTSQWTKVYFSDDIPADVLRWKDLRASLTVCPFYPEQLLLHHKQAVKNKVLIKDLTVGLVDGSQALPALSLSATPDMRALIVY